MVTHSGEPVPLSRCPAVMEELVSVVLQPSDPHVCVLYSVVTFHLDLLQHVGLQNCPP